MKCVICGKELSGRQKQYCSNKCKMKSKKLQQKNLQMVPISAKNAPYDQLETMMVLAKKITNDVKDLKREIEDIKQIINKKTDIKETFTVSKRSRLLEIIKVITCYVSKRFT